MSKIGKVPVEIPSDISVSKQDGKLVFKKKDKTIEYDYKDQVNIVIEENILKVAKKNKDDNNICFGLHRSKINNIIIGLKDGFEKKLEVNGVGYRANIAGKYLVLGLGYSHDIFYTIPEEIEIKCEKPNLIIIKGSSKELVGRTASEIIAFRKPEPYKGKGVKILGQKILRKEGKKK